MNHLFIDILNNAMAVSVLILAIIAVRGLFRKMPKWLVCLMWAMVAVKLLLPVSIESAISLVPNPKPISYDIEYAARPQIETGIPAINEAVNPVLESSLAPTSPVTSVNPVQIWLFIGGYLWIAGIAVMLLYAGFSYIHIRKRVRFAIKEHGNVYICDEIDSPFVLGIARPRIYLPSGLSEEVAGCVKAHERAHIARRDFLWKPLGYLVLSGYWFHPLCWIAYILFCKDIEIACDQKVTQNRDLHWKARYCQALLSCSINRRMIKACPVAFGEVGVKERIVMIKKYKKPTCIMIALSVAVCTLVGCCFMTDPVTGKKDSAAAFDTEVVTDTESVRDTATATDTETLTSSGNAVATEAISGEDQIIPAIVPTINLLDDPSVRSLQIIYASDKELMFVGWFGLFLYDTEKNDFIRSVDLLAPISCHPDTETISCEIKAAADGSKVYFHPPMEEYMLVYDVKSNSFEEKPYDLTSIKLYEIPDITNLEEQYELDDPRYSQTRDEYQNKIKYYFNYVHRIGDLVYTRYDDELSRAMPIFKPEEYQSASYWKHDQVKDLVKAEFRRKGEVYICEDREALAEISAAIRNAPELKGGSGCEFTYCLYLTNADGEVGMIIPATDNCNAYLTADGYFEPAREAKMNIFELIDRGVFVKTEPAGALNDSETPREELIGSEYIDWSTVFSADMIKITDQSNGESVTNYTSENINAYLAAIELTDEGTNNRTGGAYTIRYLDAEKNIIYAVTVSQNYLSIDRNIYAAKGAEPLVRYLDSLFGKSNE